MTYQQCLDHLYARLPMFSRIGAAAYKKDINNTIALCEALGNPQEKFKSIHIAGTNGKGSCSHMLASILQMNGYKTGLYTSPHLFEFGERIRINGSMIDEQFLIDFTLRTMSLCEKIQPSFFELTVAMAFCYFEKEHVDIAVIETGLGGRLDSTNIITPELSIITNIGMDHMNLLGDTLEQIAFEKAGIIKNNIPVVIGERNDITDKVFIDKAGDTESKIRFAEDHFNVQLSKRTLSTNGYDVVNNITSEKYSIETDLLGEYQQKNLRTVLTAIQILKEHGWNLEIEKMATALKQVTSATGLRGRWEILSRKPLTIIDVAHNKDGIAQMLQQLQHEHAERHWHFVLGFVKDKDISGVLKLFPAHAKYYFTNANIERALPAGELKAMANNLGYHGDAFDNVNEALGVAREHAAEDDLIVICGSFFVIAELKMH